MRRIRIIAVIVFLVPLISCRQQQAANVKMNTLKIKVSASGEISIDGQVASMNQASERLGELKQANGMVLYHREDPQGEPHPNAMRVMKLVVDNQLPIRLCAKADFSDSVDEKGTSQPFK